MNIDIELARSVCMDFDFIMNIIDVCREYYLFLESEYGSDPAVTASLRCLEDFRETLISRWYSKLCDDAIKRYCKCSKYIQDEEGK